MNALVIIYIVSIVVSTALFLRIKLSKKKQRVTYKDNKNLNGMYSLLFGYSRQYMHLLHFTSFFAISIMKNVPYLFRRM